MNTFKNIFLLTLLATLCVSCSEKVNMGSPVGTWKALQTTVTFNADGTVVRHNDGQAPDPDFLAPLEDGKPGAWRTENHNLFLITTNPDGQKTTQRYEYSVGKGSKGEPALEIQIPEGPHKSSYVFTKQ
jgi:hypothetical protein